MKRFDEMMKQFDIRTDADYRNALHEVMQQTALAGLARSGFFEVAAFYGGTCLHLFHGMQRFSEDLDFSLLQEDGSFTLETHFDAIRSEFAALGREVEIRHKKRKLNGAIDSAFVKDATEIVNIAFSTERTVQVKFEVDCIPPSGFGTETKLLMLPFSFMVRCMDLPSLYAGKMHALLFRQWKNRVKGRDWYDFEWYVRNGHVMNFAHLVKRIDQSHPGKSPSSEADFRKMLQERIAQTDFVSAKADVQSFIRNPMELGIWSADYFSQVAERMKIG